MPKIPVPGELLLKHQPLSGCRRIAAPFIAEDSAGVWFDLPAQALVHSPGHVRLGIVSPLVCPDFRPYVLDPDQIERWITAEGFKEHSNNQTFIWLTQVYLK